MSTDELAAEIDWHESRGMGTAMRCRCGARWPCLVRRLADAHAALVDGVGRIAERRMGICPLCDEHWNWHGMACPLRALATGAPEGA